MIRKKIDNFYLVERIGSGGMSEVFLGLNPRTREKRAFKILGKRATTWSLAYSRFIREVNIIRGLSHSGIIKILDNGVLDDRYYYSMEYMPGGNLSRLLERGRLPFDEALRLFIRVCDAMACAHEKNIIHRDLKPSNILLRGAGEPVVSDFGIAKVLDIQKTILKHSGEILGTIAYLAPEQRLNAKNIDRRSDVYALGSILYEMIMGFPPLGKFPWPREVQANFPQTLQWILEKCLAFEPEKRFRHAGLLQADMEKFLDPTSGKSVEAGRGNPIEEFSVAEGRAAYAAKTDRIETWFRALRAGTTRERLKTVRNMVETITPAEAKASLKLYSGEEDRVRWGLIRVFGELKIAAATPLIFSDLRCPFHTECAIEALGKIGTDEAYNAIRENVKEHPENALVALFPLALTGKQRSIEFLQRYLDHEMSVFRQAAVRALASVSSEESLQILRGQLRIEQDEKVRASLFEAVRSLESTMLRDISPQNTKAISNLKPGR